MGVPGLERGSSPSSAPAPRDQSKQPNKIRKYFLNKPTNVEHNKKKVVGHIVSTGFSDFSSGNLIKDIPDEFSGKFNIALGAVVYSHSFPEFSKLVLKAS